MKKIALLLALVLSLAACNQQTPPPEQPPAEEPTPPPVTPTPPIDPAPPEAPSNIPYYGEWVVTYTDAATDTQLIYSLNITEEAIPDAGLENGGVGLGMKCTDDTCNYQEGSAATAFGFIGNLQLDDGTAPLVVSTFDWAPNAEDVILVFYGEDTDNAVSTDAQGRQILEGFGSWEVSPGDFRNGRVTAVRIGEPRILNNPQPVDEPPPPEDPDPPTDPEPPPPEDPEPPPPPPDDPEPPVIESFTANPRTVEPGDDVRLSWEVENAETLRISPGVGTVTGSSVVVEPDETTTYTLTATNDGGSDEASVRVVVEEPDPPAPPEPQEPALQYWVRSDCGEVSTTYATVDGGTEQRDFGNGVVYEVDGGISSGTFLYISAQNQCDYGDVTVRIYKRGNIYRESTSSGAYVIATASGTW